MDGKVIRKDGERTAWKMTWIATWTAKYEEEASKIRLNPAAAHPPIMDILL